VFDMSHTIDVVEADVPIGHRNGLRINTDRRYVTIKWCLDCKGYPPPENNEDALYEINPTECTLHHQKKTRARFGHLSPTAICQFVKF
jgi:hypothetical protein